MLCDNPNGTHPYTFRDPDGRPGCVYSYDNANRVEVNLDEIAGITNEDCHGGKCADWSDFRLGCMNDDYRNVFKLTRDGAGKIIEAHKEPVSYCVEYDINPFCEEDCMSAACQELPADEKEIGIPFWRGRCSPEANSKRAEAIAAAMGIKDVYTCTGAAIPASYAH